MCAGQPYVCPQQPTTAPATPAPATPSPWTPAPSYDISTPRPETLAPPLPRLPTPAEALESLRAVVGSAVVAGWTLESVSARNVAGKLQLSLVLSGGRAALTPRDTAALERFVGGAVRVTEPQVTVLSVDAAGSSLRAELLVTEPHFPIVPAQLVFDGWAPVALHAARTRVCVTALAIAAAAPLL
eukprot:TRINITY_DN17583_c0_g1_i1.p1 TRINITY_DN17583_c0_g1~~TRINITY_DN17583_c0_g1_i1.p1  ORF type:complete len:185 (+),score=43.19 TRINITY_DN17583_c0_g1_i1:976-1530(+)